MRAAASARLCVETFRVKNLKSGETQPPPRGCVLKHYLSLKLAKAMYAAASARLCVETIERVFTFISTTQPPPRGCVLKPLSVMAGYVVKRAAASARLCVETSITPVLNLDIDSSRLRAAVC